MIYIYIVIYTYTPHTPQNNVSWTTSAPTTSPISDRSLTAERGLRLLSSAPSAPSAARGTRGGSPGGRGARRQEWGRGLKTRERWGRDGEIEPQNLLPF